jgi:hypothetical protein
MRLTRCREGVKTVSRMNRVGTGTAPVQAEQRSAGLRVHTRESSRVPHISRSSLTGLIGLLMLPSKNSGTRNCFLGESSGPTSGGRRNVLRRVWGVKGGGQECPPHRCGFVPCGACVELRTLIAALEALRHPKSDPLRGLDRIWGLAATPREKVQTPDPSTSLGMTMF